MSHEQASERRKRDGPNELPKQKKRQPLRIAVDVLREPMLALLLVAGATYLLLGEPSEALILLLFAGFSIIVTIVKETRIENVLESLRDLSAPRALVVRDGSPVRIAGREVVQGDILVLDQGDRIAADALLLDAREFESDESLLTGESVPVRKRAVNPDDQEDVEPGGDDKPQVYARAIVTRGGGLVCATATGPRSQIGAIGRSLATLETEAPRLKRETARIIQIAAFGGQASPFWSSCCTAWSGAVGSMRCSPALQSACLCSRKNSRWSSRSSSQRAPGASLRSACRHGVPWPSKPWVPRRFSARTKPARLRRTAWLPQRCGYPDLRKRVAKLTTFERRSKGNHRLDGPPRDTHLAFDYLVLMPIC